MSGVLEESTNLVRSAFVNCWLKANIVLFPFRISAMYMTVSTASRWQKNRRRSLSSRVPVAQQFPRYLGCVWVIGCSPSPDIIPQRIYQRQVVPLLLLNEAHLNLSTACPLRFVPISLRSVYPVAVSLHRSRYRKPNARSVLHRDCTGWGVQRVGLGFRVGLDS